MGLRSSHGLRALRSHDFRIIAIGNMVSQLGTWVQYVAMGWVARDLTDNKLLISLVFGAQWLPFLALSPLTGSVADRFDRRRIVMWGNVAMVVPALVLGILVETHNITIAWLWVLVVLGGAGAAFTQPAASAFVPALVPEADLHSAIALNAGMTNSTRVIGPSIGGALVAAWGVAWGFHVNAVSFLAVAFACLFVRARPAPRAPSHRSYRDDWRSGIAYVRLNPATQRILLLALGATFFTVHAGLMSIMAKDVLHGGVGTYGLLSSGPGFGFVIASLLVTSLRTHRQRTIALFVSGASAGAALLVVGFSRVVAVTFVGLGFYGMSFMTFTTVASTLLLTATVDEYRGRVMGLYSMASIGPFTVNALVGGGIATLIGAPATIVLGGVAIIVTVALFALTGSARVIDPA